MLIRTMLRVRWTVGVPDGWAETTGFAHAFQGGLGRAMSCIGWSRRVQHPVIVEVNLHIGPRLSSGRCPASPQQPRRVVPARAGAPALRANRSSAGLTVGGCCHGAAPSRPGQGLGAVAESALSAAWCSARSTAALPTPEPCNRSNSLQRARGELGQPKRNPRWTEDGDAVDRLA